MLSDDCERFLAILQRFAGLAYIRGAIESIIRLFVENPRVASQRTFLEADQLQPAHATMGLIADASQALRCAQVFERYH